MGVTAAQRVYIVRRIFIHLLVGKAQVPVPAVLGAERQSRPVVECGSSLSPCSSSSTCRPRPSQNNNRRRSGNDDGREAGMDGESSSRGRHCIGISRIAATSLSLLSQSFLLQFSQRQKLLEGCLCICASTWRMNIQRATAQRVECVVTLSLHQIQYANTPRAKKDIIERLSLII
jgi:hypothetical protein